MNTVSIIIKTLSQEEKHEFLSILRKKNRRGDTKNIELFKLIETGHLTGLDIALYGKPSKNAYHALCKRLQDSLIDFIATKSFSGETSEELEVLKLLLAARIFFEHKHYKLGFKTLKKAERIAVSLDLYSILTEIYHTKIQYAHHGPQIDLSEVIAVSKLNMSRFEQEQQLNMAYATIKAKLKQKQDTPVNNLISDTFSTFNIQLDRTLTYKSLFQLMNITATAAKLQSNYYQISPFMMTIYNIISQKQDLVDKHLFYHIEILNLMAITSFRNKDFMASTKFSEKMKTEMEKNNGAYTTRFSEKLTLIQALNYNFTGQPTLAINVLQNFTGDSLDVDLTLIMCLFQQNKFNEGYRILKNMYHSDTWYEKKAGWIWVLKKNLIEILLLIELDRLDLVLSRLQSFKNKFRKRLEVAGEQRVLMFIQLVAKYYNDPSIIVTKKFKETVEASFEWKGSEKEDIFVMSFYSWLKAKMENKPLYLTTLSLAGSIKNY